MRKERLEELYPELFFQFAKQFGTSAEDIYYNCQGLDPNNIPAMSDFLQAAFGISPSATQLCFLHHFIRAANYLEETCKELECALGALDGDDSRSAQYLKVVMEDFEATKSEDAS
jgi:hypothetical protein